MVIPVPGVPALSITKTPATNTVAQNGTGTFTLTVSNSSAAGTAATSGTVTLTDPVPAGLTVTSVTPASAGWTCTGLQSISCTTTNVLAPGASYPAVVVAYTAAANAAAGSPYTNTATVNGGGDPTGPHMASATVTVTGLPLLSITKTPATNMVTQGGSGTFTLTVSNSNAAGTAATSGTVTVTDPVPAGLTVTSVTPATGSGWTCTGLQSISCTTANVLAPGASYSSIVVAYTAALTAAAGSPYTNTASVNGGGDPTGPHTASAVVIVNGIPDMTISKTHTGSGFLQGGSVSFTLTATNIGTAPTAGSVSVTDALPNGLTATGISGGTGWTCTLAPLACSNPNVLGIGASYPPITVTALIGANVTGSLTNNTTVGGGGEVNLTNDNASDTISVSGIPDMTISKSHTGTFTAGQVGATYTIVPSNVGTGTTSGQVTVTDTLPPGFTATGISGGGWSCTVSPLSCTRSDSLAPGTPYPSITVTVNIAATVTGTVVNNAFVSGGGESNTSNDQASDPATILGLPDVTISKSHTGSTFNPGGTVTFTLNVSNGARARPWERSPCQTAFPRINGNGNQRIGMVVWRGDMHHVGGSRAGGKLSGDHGYGIDRDDRPGHSDQQRHSRRRRRNQSFERFGQRLDHGDGAASRLVLSKTHTGTVFSPGGTVTFTLTPSNIGTGPTVGTYIGRRYASGGPEGDCCDRLRLDMRSDDRAAPMRWRVRTRPCRRSR